MSDFMAGVLQRVTPLERFDSNLKGGLGRGTTNKLLARNTRQLVIDSSAHPLPSPSMLLHAPGAMLRVVATCGLAAPSKAKQRAVGPLAAAVLCGGRRRCQGSLDSSIALAQRAASTFAVPASALR